MKSLIAIALLTASTAFAQTPWFQLSDGENIQLFGKEQSFQATKTVGKVLVKTEFKNSKDVTFNFFEMKTSDCSKGYGTVYLFDLDGKEVYKHKYVSNGGTVASEVGDVICHILKNKNSN